jgi:hypothetical protein
MPRLKVYVAGAYSADSAIGALNNIRRGVQWSKKVWLAGHAPFCPWADHLFILGMDDGEMAVSMSGMDYYDASEAWLTVSDVVFVTPGWENSKGTQMEIAKAQEIGVRVVYRLEDI